MHMDMSQEAFVRKFTGKMPNAPDTTSIEHRALTVTGRTPQCGHTVWGMIKMCTDQVQSGQDISGIQRVEMWALLLCVKVWIGRSCRDGMVPLKKHAQPKSARANDWWRQPKWEISSNLIIYIYIICFCFLVDIQSLFLSLFQIYIIWDVLFNQPCGPGWGRQAMENRHNEATDQLSKLYQRKLSHESDRHLAPVWWAHGVHTTIMSI